MKGVSTGQEGEKRERERKKVKGEGGLEVGCLLQKRDHKLSVFLHQTQLNSCAQPELGLHNSARWASPHLQIIMANGTKFTEERNKKRQKTKKQRNTVALCRLYLYCIYF